MSREKQRVSQMSRKELVEVANNEKHPLHSRAIDRLAALKKELH